MDHFAKNFITPRDKIKKNPSKVGKAVHEILSKSNDDITVGEIMDEFQHKYAKEMESCLENNVNKYDPPFYVVVLTKKEPWALNVMRNWFIARQTRPSAKILREDYPNYMQTVYSYDKRSSELKIHWSLPIAQDAAVVLQNPQLYDSTLVKWVTEYSRGTYN